MNEIHVIARLRIHDDKLEEFKRLAARAMELTRAKDTGTMEYAWFFSSDATECVICEKYRDSQAFLEHLANLGETMAALGELCTASGELYGTPSPELRRALEGSPMRLFTPYQSL